MSNIIFLKEREQYEYVQITLLRYIDDYKDNPQWELRTTIRNDTMARCNSGLPTKKTVILRREKLLVATLKQVHSMLSVLNGKKPYNTLSRDLVFYIDSVTKGFNSGDIAFGIFGPSDKPYERGAHEQNIKIKLRRLAYHNLLVLRKMKYQKLPAWKSFAEAIREFDSKNKFKESLTPW